MSKYVNKPAVEKLSSLTGLSVPQIRTWFANRRRKLKKDNANEQSIIERKPTKYESTKVQLPSVKLHNENILNDKSKSNFKCNSNKSILIGNPLTIDLKKKRGLLMPPPTNRNEKTNLPMDPPKHGFKKIQNTHILKEKPYINKK